jgi:CheY-like chemotaxis protein
MRDMTHSLPDGCRILIVEDEFLIAMVLEGILEDEGCRIIGPASCVRGALLLVEQERIDAAVLDARLDRDPVTAIADALEARDVPFVFHSGYGPEHLPQQHRHRPLLRKPCDPSAIVKALSKAIDGRRSQ